MVISIRKLAAIDIVFLGFKIILAEYAFGVSFSIALGVFVLFRSHSSREIALGAYLICLGINYVPMLAYAVAIGDRESSRAELADELNDTRTPPCLSIDVNPCFCSFHYWSRSSRSLTSGVGHTR